MKYLFSSLILLTLNAQCGVFDKPENLKVLDKNISPENLGKVMKNFSRSLGVRCQHCHVGEDGEPLSSFDFPNDEKRNKKTARQMMKMVSDIQRNYLDKINNNSVKMECMSCHRGNNTPKLTKDILMTAFDEGRTGAVISKYEELKEKYFGTHSHDFSEGTLLAVVSVIDNNDTNSVLQILEYNLNNFPNGIQTLWTIAQFYQHQNDNKMALKYYNRINEVSPNPRIQNIIKDIQKLED